MKLKDVFKIIYKTNKIYINKTYFKILIIKTAFF